MSFQPNIHKEEMIAQHGITWNLPLFQNMPAVQHSSVPNWVWNGTSIKAEIFHKMKEKFAEDSLEYLNAIIALGGKATDHEVKEYFNDESKWPLAIVSARRNYFKNHPFYIITSYPGKTQLGPKGKPNTIWFVDFKQLFTLLM